MRPWLLTALLLAAVPAATDASVQPAGPDVDHVQAALPAPHESLAPPASFAAPAGYGVAVGLDLGERAGTRGPHTAFARPDRHPPGHRPTPAVLVRHLSYARVLACVRSAGPATLSHPPPCPVA